MTPLNVFVTEGNIEIYLSRLYATWEPETRDGLLRLVSQEEGRMGARREHLENGERRVAQGRELLERQHLAVAQLSEEERGASLEARLLETMEKVQALLEQHLELLQKKFDQTRL